MSFDPLEVFEQLNRYAKTFELYHVTTYDGYRSTPDGGEEGITIRIRDAGPGIQAGRYHCSAESESGRKATGNPSDDVYGAVAGVHWHDLDPHD